MGCLGSQSGSWSVVYFKGLDEQIIQFRFAWDRRLDAALHSLSGLGIRPIAALAERLSEKQYIWVSRISFESMISTRLFSNLSSYYRLGEVSLGRMSPG